MAETLLEYVAFFLFFILFAAVIYAEIQWLIRKGWATSGRATGFVFTTSVLGLFLGGVVFFVAFMVMFVMVMGPAGRGSDVPNAAYVALLVVAIITPPFLLIFLKRLFLLIFKIRSGVSAWVFSLVSSLAVLSIVVIPPPLFLYLVITLWK